MSEPTTQMNEAPKEAPDEIAFDELVARPSGPGRVARGGIVLGSGLLFAVGAMAAMGASPVPASDPAAPAAPTTGTSTPVGLDGSRDQGKFRGPGFERGGHGFGRGAISITAINGAEISLKTEDGWTRTIMTTSATTVTRAGSTIAISDLQVGDQIGFRQELATDGTYTITAIHVALPTVAGQVTAIDGSTITLKQFDGTSATVRVSSSTTYHIGDNATASLSDVTVDSFIVAMGDQAADGSIDAEAVRGGLRMGRGGHGFPGGPGDEAPDASAAPSASTTPG